MITLTAKQREALSLLVEPTAENVLLYGGSRSGKTLLFLYAMVVRALKCPDSRHVIARNISRDCRRLIGQVSLPEVHKMIGINPDFDKTGGIYHYPGGSEVWMVGMDDAGGRDQRVLGSAYSTALIEEAPEVPYESTVLLRTRLSQQNILRKRMWFSANPPSRAHYLHKLFIEKVDPLDRRPLFREETWRALQMNPDSNAQNLDPGYLTSLDGLPERQRIRFRDGNWGNPLEGVLWKQSWIDDNRIAKITESLSDIVVGVDPACGGGCETGIVAVARGETGHLYIVADRSARTSPAEWALAVVSLAREVGARCIVAEANQGGEMVRAVLQNANPALVVELVHARQSKTIRAEPVAAVAERGLLHHVGQFLELEDQLLSFVQGGDSPDRLDAMVHAVAYLNKEIAGGVPAVASEHNEKSILDDELWDSL